MDEASVAAASRTLLGRNEELNRAKSAYNVAHLTYTRLANVQKTQPNLWRRKKWTRQGKKCPGDAGVSAAKDSLAASEQALAASKASLEKDKALYGYSRITAPFDGVVTEIDAYKGALLPAGTSSNKGDQPLCHLADDSIFAW